MTEFSATTSKFSNQKSIYFKELKFAQITIKSKISFKLEIPPSSPSSTAFKILSHVTKLLV